MKFHLEYVVVVMINYYIVIFVCCLFQIFNKGILEMIGVEIGKGLDLPL